jgi:DNA-binding NarL/FixJ family response regulator
MTQASIRLLLADDHDLVREGLAALLASAEGIEVVASVAGSDTAIAEALALAPDVAVIDFQLPPQDGVAVAEALKAANSPTRVLLITGSQDRADIERIFASPAQGALHKSGQATELIAAIRALAEGDLHFSESIAALRQPPAIDALAELGKLTEREKQVLCSVAEGASSHRIAESLLVQRETVRTHRRNLMLKLGMHNSAQLTAFAIRAGLVAR